LTLVICIYVRVQLGEGDQSGHHAESGHKGVVVTTETGQNIGDQLFVEQGMTSSDEFIGEALHLGQELRGCHLQFLGVGEGDQKIGDLGLALGGEHLIYGAPDAGGRLKSMHMRKNLPGERLEEVGQYDLVTREPRRIVWIGLHRGRFVGGLVSRDINNLRRRGAIGSIEYTEKLGTTDCGQHL
jgi:hypothetical protein